MKGYAGFALRAAAGVCGAARGNMPESGERPCTARHVYRVSGIQGFMLPVRTKRSCQDSASPSRCGVCLPKLSRLARSK